MASGLAGTLPERTFQYQNSLPPLPVPPLEGSLAKYLDAGRMAVLSRLLFKYVTCNQGRE